MNVCDTETVDDKPRCPHCKIPHRLDRKGRVPIRVCAGEREDRSAPCVCQREEREPIVCPTCAGKIKLKTFACINLLVDQERASKGQPAKLPRDVAACLGCDWYVAASPSSANS